LLQGFGLNDPQTNFMSILDLVWPWRMVRSISGTAMLLGHIIFALLFVLMLLKTGEKQKSATLLANPETKEELVNA
jgi:cbb3-type cytochrome oxidase subunit 1